jgi:Holliday junction resolvase RusA-like endonuclease
MTIEFVVLGTPAPAGSKRGFNIGGRVVITDASKRSRPWKALVSDAAGMAMNDATGGRMGLLHGPLGMDVTFYLPRPKSHYGSGRSAEQIRPGAALYPACKPDTSKLLRAVEDALTGLVWRDDSQVVNQWARKMYGEPARCELRIWELNGEQP